MKELIIIRHAKTERPQMGQRDFDRRLTGRGKRQMADLLGHLGNSLNDVELVLVSAAQRTQETYALLAEAFGGAEVQFFEDLYLCSSQTVLKILSQHAEHQNKVVYIGHNEGLSDLVAYLQDDYVHVPTGGFLNFSFEVGQWPHIVRGLGVLKDTYFSEVQ